MIYKDNNQLKNEFKKFLIDNNISQREIAKKMEISPQGLSNLLNKKNLSFNDIKKILDVIDYDLHFEFKDKQDLTK